jgi:hypothetical protein
VVLLTVVIVPLSGFVASVGSMEQPVPTTFENVTPVWVATQLAGLVRVIVVVAPAVSVATV